MALMVSLACAIDDIGYVQFVVLGMVEFGLHDDLLW